MDSHYFQGPEDKQLMIRIETGTINRIIAIKNRIPEFEIPYDRAEYEKRLNSTKHLILIARGMTKIMLDSRLAMKGKVNFTVGLVGLFQNIEIRKLLLFWPNIKKTGPPQRGILTSQ